MTEYCDRCAVARARFQVMIAGLPLSLCMHHFNEHEETLITLDYEIFDLDTDQVPV